MKTLKHFSHDLSVESVFFFFCLKLLLEIETIRDANVLVTFTRNDHTTLIGFAIVIFIIYV